MKHDTEQENFMDTMLMASVNLMATHKFNWPPSWTLETKNKFLNNCLEYTIDREMYEQSAILRNVKETINKD